MDKNTLARGDHRKYLEMASDHVMEYYGFHWQPYQLRVLFEDSKGVVYISHWKMGGIIITVKLDEVANRYIVRSFKHQFARVKSIQYIEAKTRLREKGYYSNGNA